MKVAIRKSKTAFFRNGCTITNWATHTALCPIQAMERFLSMYPYLNGPVFRFLNLSYLWRRWLRVYSGCSTTPKSEWVVLLQQLPWEYQTQLSKSWVRGLAMHIEHIFGYLTQQSSMHVSRWPTVHILLMHNIQTNTHTNDGGSWGSE